MLMTCNFFGLVLHNYETTSNIIDQTTTMIDPVDIIFLDIDGVILPFGGTASDQSSNRRLITAQGCIFPDCTMDALTSLLQRANNLSLEQHHPTKKREKDASPSSSSSSSSCKLVLSSTWRARSNFIQEILDSFRAYATEKARTDPTVMEIWEPHLNSFFDITDPNIHSTRHDEIYNWLHQHQQNQTTQDFFVRSWIALDDEDLVHVEGRVLHDAKDHAVFIKSSVGLTYEDVSLGIQLLERQHRTFYSTANHR